MEAATTVSFILAPDKITQEWEGKFGVCSNFNCIPIEL